MEQLTRFEVSGPGRILFGPGALAEAAPAAARTGRRAVVVTGADPARSSRLLEALAGTGVVAETVAIPTEPTVSMAREGASRARAAGAQLVIGIGGGSAIDAAKAIAALAANDGDPLDYLEVVGAGRPLDAPALPSIAIPTTAGTGAEATRNAVLAVPERGVKVSLRHPSILPALAIVDPELTLTLPAAVTASTGLDALTQLLEAFVSLAATPYTDALCREGIPRAARSLRRAVEHGGDLAARGDLCLASLFSGLALANAGLGAVHGLAAAVGGMIPAPHGVVCARLLAPVMEHNLRALALRDPAAPARGRYDEAARLLTGEASATAADGIAFVRGLARELRIPSLQGYGLSRNAFASLAEAARRANSMKGNPLPLGVEELTNALEQAL